MTSARRRFEVIGFFALLFVIDCFLYFRHVGHFFQGGTVFLINQRARSLSDLVHEFTQLSPSGWYRPLANELVESVFYPIFGLHPIPYRIPVYALFMAITVALYALVLALTRRHLAAALAALFFSIHTTNAYTTYDVGFMPELLYTFLYIVATLSYLRYLESGNKAAYRWSVACFVGSLLSKEAAVTLPATLFLLHVLFGPVSQPFRERVFKAVRSTALHAAILLAYLVFAFGYMHVMSMSPEHLLNLPKVIEPGSYEPAFNKAIFTNADLALTWAFNIPRGFWSQWQHLRPGMLTYLKVFRALMVALMVVVLFRPERKTIVFGSAWFFITILPALPLQTHFIPYYLSLPIVGLSLIAGTVFTWGYDGLRRVQPLVAAATIVIIFGGVLYVTNRSIRADIRDNSLLGGPAQLGVDSLSDMKRFYPLLPADSKVYFLDAEQPLSWEHDSGGLIKMAYGTDQVSVLYESLGTPLPEPGDTAIVLRVHDGHLIDESSNYRADPFKFIRYKDSAVYHLDLSASDVAAGGKYALSIKGLRDVPVRIAYTLNEGPVEVFDVALDSDGVAVFNVSQETPKGIYRYLGFRVSGESEWIRADKTVTVH